MSLYVLDTDTLTLFEKNHPVVIGNVRSHHSSELAITVLTAEEQLSGWYTELRRAKGNEKLAAIYLRLSSTLKILSRMEILTYTTAAMARFEKLHAKKLGIGKMDLRIAAIVLEHNSTLVTRNLRDFNRVPGLQIEDWSK